METHTLKASVNLDVRKGGPILEPDHFSVHPNQRWLAPMGTQTLKASGNLNVQKRGPMSKPDHFSVHQEWSTGEVAKRIDPNTFEQPASGQVPPTRRGFMALEPRPTVNEPLFDPTTAQRIRHRQLMDEARRDENHRDYYDTELGIIEPDKEDTILTADNWEDKMVEVVLDSGACRYVMARENTPDARL